jgi:hypothetical protein
VTAIVQKIFWKNSTFRVPAILTVMVICFAWLSFPASFTFENISRVIFVSAPTGVTPAGERIPTRFFELARINIFEAIKTISVFNGADGLMLLLTFGGLTVLWTMRKRLNRTLQFLFLFGLITLLFIPVGVVLQIGLFRVVRLASPLFPIFIALFLVHVVKEKKFMLVLLFSFILFFATIELYKCQPLLPRANILSDDLPFDQPIYYLNNVNSIYQRQMIDFVYSFVVGRIASDVVTANQITGLTDFNYSSSYLTFYYPLDDAQTKRTYDYFLIHLPGISGPIEEKAEFRTTELISESIYTSSIIYTNGESYVLVPPFSPS